MSVLDELVAGALEDQRTRELTVSLEDVKKATLAAPAPIDATRWLKRADGIPVIAEIKRASPSKGHLSDIPDPAALAREYEKGGASASSVLTEGRKFLGSLDDFDKVRAAVHIPVLRKDFIVTDYQIFEARAHGADLVLLIVAALDDAQLKHLLDLAHELGMTVLVETHTREEIERARKAGAKVIGINARNLKNLKVDVNKYNELAADLPDDVIKVAVIGKPNVGKSSLINRILGEERVIVSNVAGTTRDAIDSYFENETGKYNFIDTAGMRKKSKVDDNIEKYSVLRATMAIERSDVCLIMIDAQDGVTEQDTKVAGLAHEAGKACIIVVNKWDLVEKDDKTMDRMREDIRRDLSYMTYAPIVFISALTGQRVTRLFELINYVREQSSMRITTGMLNSVLADAQTRVQPPTDKGRRLKIYYMTQASTKPPTFVIFVNRADLFHFSYQRYLENQIREVFGLTGTPVRMVIRERGDKD